MKARIKITLVIALCAILSGCSAMQGIGAAVGALGPSGPSLDATAVVGAENVAEGDAVVGVRRVEDRRVDAGVEDTRVEVHDVSGVSNVTSSNVSAPVQEEVQSGVSSRDWSAEAINQVTNLNQIPPLFLILFALGWLLPGPADILRGLKKTFLFFIDLFRGQR